MDMSSRRGRRHRGKESSWEGQLGLSMTRECGESVGHPSESPSSVASPHLLLPLTKGCLGTLTSTLTSEFLEWKEFAGIPQQTHTGSSQMCLLTVLEAASPRSRRRQD
jgi:hypothetical protein